MIKEDSRTTIVGCGGLAKLPQRGKSQALINLRIKIFFLRYHRSIVSGISPQHIF